MPNTAPQSVGTTTLRIDIPDETALRTLQDHFLLIRYVIPDRFKWINGDSKYSRLHIALKAQLNRPYVTFQYDELDGKGKYKMVVYALYRREEVEPHFQGIDIDLQAIFKFVHGLLEKREISFADLKLHMALKLLLTDYFHGGWGQAFVGLGKHYIYVSGFNGFHKCLEVQLKGHRDNDRQTESQWFHVQGATRYFRTLKPEPEDAFFTEQWRRYHPAYTLAVRNQQTTLVQLLPTDTRTPRDKTLIPSKKGKRGNLPYHHERRLNQGRGKPLYDFHVGFIQYLDAYGVTAATQQRRFQRYPSRSKGKTLTLQEMGTLTVLDRCVATDSVEKERRELHKTLHKLYPNYRHIVEEDLADDDSTPVLILQNYGKEDFDAGGWLEGHEDPKPYLYRQYPHVPKQTLDIRPKASKKPSADTDEDQTAAQHASLTNRLEVSLNELYLKHLLINRQPAAGRLPYYSAVSSRQMSLFEGSDHAPLERYAFLRKKTYDGIPREILLIYNPDEGCLKAHDVGSSPEKRHTVLQELGLDWKVIRRELLRRQFKWDEANEEAKAGAELTRYDLILSPGLAVLIEDVRESVFYNYEGISNALAQNRQEFPVSQFRLQENDTGFTPEQRTAYNTFLAREVHEDRMTYARLKHLYGEHIAELLKLYDSKGNIRLHPLTEVYQQRGMLGKAKATELTLTSQGIWFDSEGRYVVGSPDAIKDKQETAHIVRQLVPVVGVKQIDFSLMMSLMDVRFVRNKRFTVYPYPFKFIDLFAEMTQWNS